MSIFYNQLDKPWAYTLMQHVMAPGMYTLLPPILRELMVDIPVDACIVDLGCGPESMLWDQGYQPIGIDITASYAHKFKQRGETSIIGSIGSLPLRTGSVDAAWTQGVFHHLEDEMVYQACSEMVRVCRIGGRVVVLDAVLPEPPHTRPIAYLSRKLDRGGNVRRQEDLRGLLPLPGEWSEERHTYTYLGHELVSFVLEKTQQHQDNLGK